MGRFPKWSRKYHSKEVANALDGSGILCDFLVEAVAEVVGRVRGDDECLPALLGDEGGETAGGGGLAYTALTTNEDPTERLLIENVLESACEIHLKLSHIYLNLINYPTKTTKNSSI